MIQIYYFYKSNQELSTIHFLHLFFFFSFPYTSSFIFLLFFMSRFQFSLHFFFPSFIITILFYFFIKYFLQLLQIMKKSNLSQDLQRMSLFQNQLKQMNSDYEFMIRNKEQAKKQLDARFLDLQRKIQNTKDFIVSEGNRINDTILAFQHKFNHQIKSTQENFESKLKQLKNQLDQNYGKTNTEIVNISTKLNEEKLERIKQFQDNTKDIKQKIESIKNNKLELTELVQTQKNTRIQRQSFIMAKLNQQIYKMTEKARMQRQQRNLKLKQFKDFIVAQLDSQSKYNKQSHQKNFKEFTTLVLNLETQMNTRFSNKDQIINSMSKILKTFQQTLRHPH